MGTIGQAWGSGNKNPLITDQAKVDPYIYKEKLIAGTINVLLNLMEDCSKKFD